MMTFTTERNGVDETQPLIYLWTITYPDGRISRYVGKAVRGSKRPLTQYRRNLENLLAGRPYRKSKPDRFRTVHRAMASCV